VNFSGMCVRVDEVWASSTPNSWSHGAFVFGFRSCAGFPCLFFLAGSIPSVQS
jgi:hypothetical protein